MCVSSLEIFATEMDVHQTIIYFLSLVRNTLINGLDTVNCRIMFGVSHCSFANQTKFIIFNGRHLELYYPNVFKSF